MTNAYARIRMRHVLCLLCVAASAWAAPQPGQIDLSDLPAPNPHYQPEYTFDQPIDPGAWDKQPDGLHAAFGSTDERYFRCEPPPLPHPAKSWTATAWRGERVNAQILVWSSQSQEQVRVMVGQLRSDTGEIVEPSRIKLRLVRYVLSNFPYEANGFSCGTTNPSAFLLPDRLESFDPFNLPARTVRPLWLCIDIPRGLAPGDYTGALAVDCLHGHAELQLKLHIDAQVLPEPRDWKFRLDLWQNPWVLASYFRVTPWSDAHKLLLHEHLKLYADAGGKFITTYSTYSPWSDNSYVPEGTMIEWIRTSTGSWRFDYSIFDQYVQLAMDAGIDHAITIYTPVPWGHRFRYLDQSSGNYLTAEWPPASEPFRSFWPVFLDDLKAHLLTKGWFKKTYLGINENPLEITLAAIKVIKEHSPDWKITYAGDWHPELSSLLDDYSVLMNREPAPPALHARTAQGFTTTFYVCCNPDRPNNFVFSSPAESRFLGWYAAACSYNGFLRWAYDAWPADPTRDARHTLWPAGDCFLVYPGASSSIRFEKLREGIVDWEKIRLLKKWAANSANPDAKELIKQLELHLSSIAAHHQYLPPATVSILTDGNLLLERLSQQLGQ
jgi:hypothetical protein